MMSTRRRLAVAGVLLAFTAGTITGCGSDDPEDSSKEAAEATTTAADSGGEGGEEAGGTQELCASYTTVSAAFGGGEEPDPETLGPLLDSLEADAPEEIADSLGVMVAAGRTMLESGGEDSSGFESPEFEEAIGEVDPFMYENCEFDTKAEVVAKDYSFGGIPAEIEAGSAAFMLTNEGDEAHEMAIMRKADGVTESWDEILELGEEEGQAKVEQVGGTFAASNGDSGLAITDLTPGEYIAICFVPTGTTVDDEGEHEGDGPPHFVQGMKAEFTVV